jgi:Zn-dependent peptidase ImmA (M78 family)/DNA-binding XRE family transcriptional regulator
VPEADRIIVIPDQLSKARESLGLGRKEVAETLRIDEKKLEEWERGVSEPPLEALWDLAELYQRSTDYFLRTLPALPERLNFRLKHHRVLKDLPHAVRKVIVRFEELCRAEFELEEALQRKREILIKRSSCECAPEELAERERRRLGLGENPIRDVRNLIASQGVRVFVLPIPDVSPIELSGISWWHEEYGPCMLINGRNNAGRRSFTIAHEYVHLLCNDSPTACAYMLEIPEERFANRFATVFLMPARAMRDLFLKIIGPPGSLPTDQALGRLARHFGVSLEAAGRRLEELGLIPEGTTDSRIADWEKRPTRFRAPRGPKWRRQLGEDFVSLALSAYSAGHLSASKLARYFGLDLRDVLEVVRQARSARSE